MNEPGSSSAQTATAATSPRGYLMLTLHAHLPFVIHHGTWPHGMEWLLEAAAESYLPLLRVFKNLQRDGIALHCNVNLSPVLLEQLAHPEFKAEFPRYLERKTVAAREDAAFFLATNQAEYARLARFWESFFAQASHDFEALGGDIIRGFREMQDAGIVEIITCCATHGYLPLLGTDESVRAQVALAVDTHTRHLGTPPRGIWAPECGYRPAGQWSYPVWRDDGKEIAPAFRRAGVEEFIAASGLKFFFVDTHLIEDAAPVNSPYAPRRAGRHEVGYGSHSLYKPWIVNGAYASGEQPVTVFPRDPRTGEQVWSGENGYPGDFAYLDFHKKRWPGGHRYWRVTGPDTDMADKQIYDPEAARDRIRSHAEHFVDLVQQTLAAATPSATPPILCAPFDAELFGHWWCEGPLWLEEVARQLHARGNVIALTAGSAYLDRSPATAHISLPEGSWGAAGGNDVWLNSETRWTYSRIYPAEIYLREVCTAARWNSGDPLAKRIVQQLCRELLLMESSDWQFLITTGAARDYAELRFKTHADQFDTLKWVWESFDANATLTPEQEQHLTAIETRDDIFREIDPCLWASTPAVEETISTTAQVDPHANLPETYAES